MKEKSVIDENRIGIFTITSTLLRDFSSQKNLVKILNSGIIIVETEHKWDKSTINYTAFCKDFDIVVGGNLIPKYLATVSENNEVIWIKT